MSQLVVDPFLTPAKVQRQSKNKAEKEEAPIQMDRSTLEWSFPWEQMLA